MKLDITGPIDQAIERTKRMLFQEATVGKWFVLGVSAWLAHLAEGGGAPSMHFGFDVGQQRRLADDWQVYALFNLIVLVILVGGLVLSVVLLWLRCRFKFIFLDNVVRDRTDIAENWTTFKRQGNGLFGFYLALTIVTSAIALLGLAAGIGLAWPEIQTWRETHEMPLSVSVVAGLVVWGSMILLGLLAHGVIDRLTVDFVVPIMARQNIGPVRGWKIFREQVIRGRVGSIVLYVLLSWVLRIVAGIVGFTLMCLTCCIGGLPYLSSVLLLPIIVFFRTYPLYVLGQVGPEFALLETPAPPPDPTPTPTPNPA